MFFRKKFLFFAKKKSHFKLKWACFEREKTCDCILETFSVLNPFIAHAKPWVKNRVKIFVLCTLYKSKSRKSSFFLMLLICFCSNWEPGFVSKLDFAIDISGVCTTLLLSQKEQRGRKIGGNRNKREPTSGKCQGLW